MTAAVDGASALAEVLATVDYLRVTVGDEPDDRWWLPAVPLVTDPDHLMAVVRPTAADRGTDRDDVALSLFVQGYSFRVASVAIGAWLLHDLVLDVSPERVSIALGRSRPNALHLDRLVALDTDDPLAALHDVLIEGHLAPLLATARAACRIGGPLLWSNVGAALASSFGAFMGPRPDLYAGIRRRFEDLLAAGRPELAATGRVVHLGPGWAWERSACCLFYKTDSGFRCEDCSLWTAAERSERYEQVLGGRDT